MDRFNKLAAVNFKFAMRCRSSWRNSRLFPSWRTPEICEVTAAIDKKHRRKLSMKFQKRRHHFVPFRRDVRNAKWSNVSAGAKVSQSDVVNLASDFDTNEALRMLAHLSQCHSEQLECPREKCCYDHRHYRSFVRPLLTLYSRTEKCRILLAFRGSCRVETCL